MRNDQLSEDGAKVNGNLKPEVQYKSMGSKCGSSNNLPHELRAGHLVCHIILLHGKKCMASKMAYAQLEWPHLLPILLYGTFGFKLPLTFALIDQSIRIYTVRISSIESSHTLIFLMKHYISMVMSQEYI